MEATNRKFYWIRLKTDFFSREDIDFILSQTNGCEYIVLYQMLCLSTVNTEGRLETQINEVIVPYDINKIVRDTKYFEYDTVAVALELFKKLGLIYEEEDHTLKIAEHHEMVGSCITDEQYRENARIRQQKHRAKLRELQNKGCHVTGNVTVTQDGHGENKRLESSSNSSSINNNSESSQNEINDETATHIYEQIENNFGILISPMEMKTIDKWLEEFTPGMVEEAIRIATINQKKTIGYASGILNNWHDRGYKTIEDLNKHLEERACTKEIFDYDWLNEG